VAGSRSIARTLGRGLALALVAVLAVGMTARAAEVEVAEVEGDANLVTVEQGRTIGFTLTVRASGMIRCAATPDNPATATFPASFSLDANGWFSTGASASVPFFGGVEGGDSCQVTWPGDPASQTIPMTVSAHSDTPLGTYSFLMRATTTTPPGTGDRLEDRTRTVLRFTVVEGSDSVPPDVACGGPDGLVGDNGWYVTAVTHLCTASDAGSGLVDPADAAFSLSTTGEGTVFTDARTVADSAGNATNAGPFGPYAVDLEDPEAIVSVPADGAAFVVGSVVDAEFACSDSTSGVAVCDGDDPKLDTSSVGTKRFKVHSKDRAGRATVVEHEYAVVYDFADLTVSGARHPKAGSAVPVSWTLNGVSDPSTFVALDSVLCEGGASEGETPGRSDVSYSKGNDRFHAVWKTEAGWSGSCRSLQVSLSDGTVHTLTVSFR